MTVDYVEIGRNVRKFRCQKGLKQAELADLINVSAQHICHIENYKTKPSLSVLIAIANALDTDVDSLLGKNISAAHKQKITLELAQILHNASPAQLQLCVELCRTVIKMTDNK